MPIHLSLLSALTRPLFTLGGNPVSAAAMMTAAATVAAGWVFSRTVQKLLHLRLGRARLDSGVGYAAMRFFHYIVLTLAVLLALQSMGFNLSSLAVLGGFFGVGLGFGLQNITSNFVSGVILLLEHPIQVGDKITIGPHIGTVQSIGMRSTEVVTFDNVTLILPNAQLIDQLVINWTHGDPRIRVHVPFGVAYGTDIERLGKVSREAIAGVAGVLPDHEPELRFLDFGDSSLDFELLVWIGDPLMQFRVKSDAYFALEAALRRAGIEIPFPQRVVHMR
jgi:small-conductance mechanosensitive channel